MTFFLPHTWQHTIKRYSLLLVSLYCCLLSTHTMAQEKMKLNMKNADIRTVIQWIAEKTKKNYIIDPRVKGKITVLSSEAMTLEEAQNVFLTALDVYGFAAVESGNNVKIIPNAQARSAGLPLVESFQDDQASIADLVLHVIKIENLAANEIVTTLRPLVPQVGHLAAFPSNNSILIADRAGNIQRLSRLIRNLDQTGDLNIEIIPIQYATAKELIDVITPLINIGNGNKKTNNTVNIASDDRSNSILMTGEAERRAQIRQLIERLDSPLTGSGNTKVVYLNYIDAAEIVPILEGMSGSIKEETKDAALLASEISIQSSETTNSLIITAPPSLLDSMLDVIAQLDIQRSQILIEAIIVEVSERFTERLGIYWSSELIQNDGTIGSINLATDGASASLTPTDLISSSGFNLGVFRNGNLNALIDALATDSRNNTLSTPSLVTLDNSEAEILVGENVPFVTGSLTTSSTNDRPFQTIQRQDVGLTLKITPKVNNQNTITLEIEQDVESVSETQVDGAQDLTTEKRSIKTEVLVRNAEILVLGGLIQDELSTTHSKVPLLGDIPLLGRLFRNSSETIEKRNLMVFIKPTILDSIESVEGETKDKYNLMQDHLEGKINKPKKPTLPEFESLNNDNSNE